MTKEEKQIKLGMFIEREVYQNESMLVGTLLSEGRFQYDDIENLQKTDEELKEEGYENTQEARDNGEDTKEIYEWWSASDFLLQKLEEKGEPILKTDLGSYWGRTCTGQAISLDGVIEEIWNELQKYQ